MGNFELLEREIIDMCRNCKLDFEWTYDVRMGYYRFKFREKDRAFSMSISELDLAYKSFAAIKAEFEHLVRLFKNNQLDV